MEDLFYSFSLCYYFIHIFWILVISCVKLFPYLAILPSRLSKRMWCIEITFVIKFASIHLDTFECQPFPLAIKFFLSLNWVTKKFQLPQWMMTKNIRLPNHVTTIFRSSPKKNSIFSQGTFGHYPKILIFQSRMAWSPPLIHWWKKVQLLPES